ncbi:MAG: hypothetical protein H5U02_00195 [Clostridia bacterium]|nr:hypothetical protein [Clostridia bacterium]
MLRIARGLYDDDADLSVGIIRIEKEIQLHRTAERSLVRLLPGDLFIWVDDVTEYEYIQGYLVRQGPDGCRFIYCEFDKYGANYSVLDPAEAEQSMQALLQAYMEFEKEQDELNKDPTYDPPRYLVSGRR